MGISQRSLIGAWTLLTVLSGRTEAAPWLHLGSCVLAKDPQTELDATPGFSACARGRAGAEITATFGNANDNHWIQHADGSLGLYYSDWLGLLGRAQFRETRGLGRAPGSPDRLVAPEYFLVQLGNPALDRFRVEVGRVDVPFGVGLSEASASYRSYEDHRFWDGPQYGVTLTVDNKVNTRFDVGYATDDFSRLTKAQLEAPTAPPEAPVAPGIGSTDLRSRGGAKSGASARLAHDVSALDGSRLIVSGYGENHGERRMGFAFVNVSRRDDLTLFEFARRQVRPDGQAQAFSQVLRLAYLSAWRDEGRFVGQFDDERFRFRAGTFGREVRLFGHAVLSLHVSYRKSETGDEMKRWQFTSGVEARL